MKTLNLLFLSSGLFLFSCGSADENSESSTSEDTTTEDIQTDETEDSFEFDITLTNVEKHKIPDGCDYSGKVIDVNSWVDKNGENIVIRSIGTYESSEPTDEYADPMGSQYLYVYHYKEDGKNWELVREVSDYIKDCEFDVIVSHVPTAIELKDIDNDGVGEIAFVYRLACTSDVSSSNQKLIMLEDGDKYILRGFTEVMGEGGDFEVGEEFNDAPEGFLDQAKKMWEENRTEYDFEL